MNPKDYIKIPAEAKDISIDGFQNILPPALAGALKEDNPR